eukprot:6216696-Amphidinium_carterae.4
MATLVSYEKHRQFVDLFWEFLAPPASGFGPLVLCPLITSGPRMTSFASCPSLRSLGSVPLNGASYSKCDGHIDHIKCESSPASKRPKAVPRVPSDLPECEQHCEQQASSVGDSL